jgi:N utilization substance protein A
VESGLAEKLVGEGFLTYDELSIIEPDALMEMGELTEDQANHIVTQAETKAQEAEVAAAVERKRQREQDRIDAATREAEAAEAAQLEANGDGAAPAVEPEPAAEDSAAGENASEENNV